ncbi:MAG: hypothetical protein A3C36_03430 [Omnitrophica WOR_2 bacterium RIFCSPHIGHO2_02_FULL_52_10]|nr:MAG: hypothetical protein A3C36_03430 [Omnitrophica WOR_2 bacterium RIFCSPHIGHO2_02_FULL_52_10]
MNKTQSSSTRQIALPVDVVSDLEILLTEASNKKQLNADKRRQFEEAASFLKQRIAAAGTEKVEVPATIFMMILRLLAQLVKHREVIETFIDALLG